MARLVILQAKGTTPWVEDLLGWMGGRTNNPLPVLALFDRSFYFGSDAEHLCCVGSEELGPGPLNLLVALPPGLSLVNLGIGKGDLVSFRHGRLEAGKGLRIELEGAVRWRPKGLDGPPSLLGKGPLGAPPDPSGETPWDKRFHLIENFLKASSPSGGLGPLAAAALNLSPGGFEGPLGPPPVGSDLLVRRALPCVEAFLRGLAGDEEALRLGAEGLVGLGPGLTPSGDDWLGGFMTAAWVAATSPLLRCRLERAAEVICERARGRTPLISEGLLRLAVRGISADSHHQFLSAFFSDPPGPDLDRALRDVIRMGHTSGWDALSGLLWGVRWGAERGEM